MDDSEFLRTFHEGSIPSDEFRHRGHLRLAWLVLSRYSRIEAESIVAREIQRFAVANRASNRYHDTLTRFLGSASRTCNGECAGGWEH